MRKRAYIYAGETVVLRFEAHTEGKVLDLSGYDVEIDIATTAMGHHIVKCSAENSVDVSQAARGMLLCPLSVEDTGSLTPGTATIGVRLLHDKFVRMGFDASIEVLRQGATPSAVLSRTAQPVVTLHTPCIWVNMDFAATRGDDGKTPYVGENGNWFIGDEDTGERALGVTYDDLTPEQIAELQRPATEAAAEANDAAQAAATATKEAKAATEDAKSASDRAERMAEEARNEAAAAASAAEAAATATEEADAAAVTANAAAQAANTAAAGIDEKIANKADLDPETGYVPSSQIAPLQGKQTGVQMGSGTFSSTAAPLLIKGDVSIEAFFILHPNSKSSVIYTEGTNSKLRTRLYMTADNRIVASYKGGPTNEFYAQLNTPYHIVLTKDSLFVNGVRVQSVTPGDGDPVMLMLGSQYISESTPSNSFFNGIINSVRLFNYALSASEVAALWNGGHPERYMLPSSGEMRTGLVAEYIAAGLLTDRWRDTSGAGLDLPYLSTVAGQPADLDYQQPPATPSGSPLHNLFIAAGAVWDANTKFWKYGKLSDISTDEMTNIYALCSGRLSSPQMYCAYWRADIRTNLMRYTQSGAFYSTNHIDASAAFVSSSIEVANIGTLYASAIGGMFRDASKLYEVNGILSILRVTNPSDVIDAFRGAVSLVKILISKIAISLSFAQSPLLSLESLQYLVQNAANTTAIIVTVHADVYAKLTDPTNTDWYAINAAAQAKNISFATA